MEFKLLLHHSQTDSSAQNVVFLSLSDGAPAVVRREILLHLELHRLTRRIARKNPPARHARLRVHNGYCIRPTTHKTENCLFAKHGAEIRVDLDEAQSGLPPVVLGHSHCNYGRCSVDA